MNDPTVEFVERMGQLGEHDGMSRIAGRIFGYMLLATEPVSLDDLAAGLAVSKASVSNDARRLAEIGLVELVTKPGDRRDYYRIAADSFAQSMRRRLARVRAFHAVLNGVRGLHEAVPPVVRERLEEFEAGTLEMTHVLEMSIARWQARPATVGVALDGGQ